MSTHLQLIEQGQILDIQFYGPVSFSDRTDMLETLRPVMQRHPVSKLLVDLSDASVDHDEKPGAASDFTTELATMPFVAGTSIAYVAAPLAAAEPVEWLGHAIGLRVRLFNSREAALAWLKAEA